MTDYKGKSRTPLSSTFSFEGINMKNTIKFYDSIEKKVANSNLISGMAGRCSTSTSSTVTCLSTNNKLRKSGQSSTLN